MIRISLPLLLILSTVDWHCCTAAVPDLKTSAILSMLPAGSKIADDIPIRYYEGLTTAEIQAPIIRADTDGDGHDEIIVAYYTPPHSVYDRGLGDYYNRAHVAVCNWNETTFTIQWTSPSWGSQFRGRMNPDLPAAVRNGFAQNFFRAFDITQDGVPEIIATRSSFGAEGSRVDIWRWNGESYESVEISAPILRMVQHSGELYLLPHDGVHSRYMSTRMGLIWDKSQNGIREVQLPQHVK